MTTRIATITPSDTPPRQIGPLEMAWLQMLDELMTLRRAGIPEYPSVSVVTPEDHEAVAAHVRAVSLIAGRWLRKVGLEVRSNALCRIELARFADDTFLEAIDGWATGEIELAARTAADEIEDAGYGDAGDRAWDERRV